MRGLLLLPLLLALLAACQPREGSPRGAYVGGASGVQVAR